MLPNSPLPLPFPPYPTPHTAPHPRTHTLAPQPTTPHTTPPYTRSTAAQVQRLVLPKYRTRMLRHEAGHFLVGYLCGLPVEAYTANAVRNAVQFWALADRGGQRRAAAQLGFDTNVAGAYQDGGGDGSGGGGGGSGSRGRDNPLENKPLLGRDGVPPELPGSGSPADRVQGFFEPGGRGNPVVVEIEERLDPRGTWPFPRGIDHDTIDRLAAVSLAGVVSELLEYGDGEGGFADLSQLQVGAEFIRAVRSC